MVSLRTMTSRLRRRRGSASLPKGSGRTSEASRGALIVAPRRGMPRGRLPRPYRPSLVGSRSLPHTRDAAGRAPLSESKRATAATTMLCADGPPRFVNERATARQRAAGAEVKRSSRMPSGPKGVPPGRQGLHGLSETETRTVAVGITRSAPTCRQLRRTRAAGLPRTVLKRRRHRAVFTPSRSGRRRSCSCQSDPRAAATRLLRGRCDASASPFAQRPFASH